LLAYLRSRFPNFWTAFDPAFFVEQMKYALPFGLTGILWLAQNDIHNYFVAHKFTAAEFAIYAYGCFEVPLIAMLSESVTSVLIPRMNALQLAGDREEMIRLTARAMQKLAFFYFPIYVFLMITAKTFITTLFTQQYAASASVFVIFLTLLPFSILVTDPVVRSFKELGRMFLLTRVLVLTGLVAVLYFGLDRLSMTGMITVAVGAILIEKLIAETMVIKKLGVGRAHLPLLKNVVKTAGISIFAGAITYFFYTNIHPYALNFGEALASGFLHETRLNARNLVGGSVVLAASGIVFAVAYLIPANLWGVIEEDEKHRLTALLRRVLPKGPATPLADAK
jgi:O-antigen/teichoic acid export membrane protein